MKSAPSGQPSSSMVTTHSLPPVQIPPHMPVSSPVARMPHHGIHHHISIAPVNGKLAPVHSATTASSMGSPTSSTGGNGTPTNGDNNNNNNNKRPLMTTKDGKQLSEKKLRRLEKNRLSARECRRRKRQATEDLERQINVLEGENLRLRLQLSVSSNTLFVRDDIFCGLELLLLLLFGVALFKFGKDKCVTCLLRLWSSKVSTTV